MSKKLFIIERNKNNNTVNYDLLENGNIDIYWILNNNKREPLNFIENKMAYGIDVTNVTGQYTHILTFKSLPLKKIFVGNGQAYIYINNDLCVLNKIYVNATENFIGYPTVNYVDIYGINKNNTNTKERIMND